MHAELEMSRRRQVHGVSVSSVPPWFVLLSFLPAILSAQAPDPARTRLDQARALAAQGKAEDALVALRAAVALHRGDVDVSREYQNALARLGRKEEGVREYRALAEAFPDEPTWHYLYGRLLDGEALEKEFRRALELSPSFYWAHFGLGQYFLDRGRVADALPHLARARDLRRDLLDPADLLAKAHYVAGDYEKAEQAWRDAAGRFPDSPLPRLGLGVMYKTIGQADPGVLPQAVGELTAVVEKWPDTWEAYEPLMQACYSNGEAAAAEAWRAKAREAGKRAQKTDMIVDVVDDGARVLIFHERLGARAGEPWLRVTVSAKEKGRAKLEETPAALAVPAGPAGVELFLADPAKPDGRGALLQRYEKTPPHADLVARLKAALAK